MARSSNIYGSNPTDAASRIANKALTGEAKDDVWGPVRDSRVSAKGNSNVPKYDKDEGIRAVHQGKTADGKKIGSGSLDNVGKRLSTSKIKE